MVNILRLLPAAIVTACLTITTACTTPRRHAPKPPALDLLKEARRPAPKMPPLESRKSGEWRASASTVHAGKYTIYYHGTTQADPDATPEHWTGSITGDIFVTSPEGYVMIPKGALSIVPRDTLRVQGVHKTILFDPPGAPQQ